MLVFHPISVEHLRALGRGEPITTGAYADTEAFREAFGLVDGDPEDAERTLLYLAGLDALREHGRRLVAVAEGPGLAGADVFGSVGSRPVAMRQISALFADDAESAGLAAATRKRLDGLDFADAWDHRAHQDLLENADLSWYGPEEWALLVAEG